MKTVWRVFAYLKRYPALAAGTLACAILGTLMVIVFPAVTKLIVDEVVNQHREERLMPLVLFGALAFLLQHGLNALRIILNNTFEQRVIFDLRSDLYSHIQMLPLRWFDNRATGDLMTRVLGEGAVIAGVGIVAGVVGGFALAKFVGSYITDVRLPGMVPILGAGVVLVGAAVLASLMPAARASRVDVIQALRSE